MYAHEFPHTTVVTLSLPKESKTRTLTLYYLSLHALDFSGLPYFEPESNLDGIESRAQS